MSGVAYGLHMKTTVSIDDALMERIRDEAARRGTTVSALVEAGLRRILSDEPEPASLPDRLPPLPTWNGGEARVDVADREALVAVLGDEEPPALA